MSGLEWMLFVALFGLGYCVYRVEIVLVRIEKLLLQRDG